MKKFLDQYGNEAPSNLKALNDTMPNVWNEEELKQIGNLDWYEKDRMILVPSVEKLTDFLTDADGLDGYFDDLQGVQKIDDCLHRWNDQDGFYHA